MANAVKPSFRNQLLITAIMTVAVVALIYIFSSLLPEAGSKQVSYSDFLSEVRAGHVAEVQITEKKLIGILKEEKPVSGEAASRMITATRLPGMEAVARARQVLTEEGIKPVEIDSLPVGDPKEVILDQAKNWDADLIVVGSHGYHGIDRLMLGSVSEAVAIHADCSVEVIRGSRLTAS